MGKILYMVSTIQKYGKYNSKIGKDKNINRKFNILFLVKFRPYHFNNNLNMVFN